MFSNYLEHIKGPSVVSTFFAYHKYYTRLYLDKDPTPNKYGIVQANTSAQDIIKIATRVIGKHGLFIKPTTRCSSQGIMCVNSIEDLPLAVQQLNQLPNSIDDIGFLNQYINVKSYPYTVNDTIMVEEYVPCHRLIQGECCVQNGQIIHWATAEWPYYQNKHIHCKIGGFTPASLSNDDVKYVWKLTDAIISKMIDHAFGNQFVHCEVFMVDGDFKLVEVNGRIDPSQPTVYNIVYENGDSWQALLHLRSGKKVTAPKHKGMIGM
ncbi:uncharacterized protein LOC144350591, partial [Saccoglossus kowalevskii]